MGDRETLNELRRLDELQAKAGGTPNLKSLGDPSQTLAYKMGQAGAQPAQGLGSYAAQSLIEGAPSTAGAIMGTPGGIPGMAAGAAVGETLRQAAKSLTHPSVMPGVPNKLDLAPVATTAALTAAIPAGLVGGTKLLGNLKDKFVTPVIDLLRQGGEKDLTTKYIKDKLLDPTTLSESIEAAKHATEIVPGHQPTMAQVMAHIPGGSPLQAHQQTIAKSPLGVSGSFGEREAKQRVAEEVAKRYANTMTVPKGLEALDRANAGGGVPVQGILDKLESTLATPEVQGSPVSNKALESVKEQLAKMAGKTGVIDARTLYQFKKEGIDQVVDAAFEKTSPKVSEKFRANNLIQVKNMLDDAIEQGGGTGWKEYLKDYAGRMQKMEEAVASREGQYKPLQKTNLADPEVDKLQIPNVLDRPISYANAIIRRFKGDIQPRLHAEFQHLYQDPHYYAQQMSQVPVRYRPMVEALLKQAGGLTGAQMGAQIAHTP